MLLEHEHSSLKGVLSEYSGGESRGEQSFDSVENGVFLILNNMLESLGVLLEVRISGNEARTRQLPVTIGKLILYAVERTKEEHAANMGRLAHWLSRWTLTDESLYASPIVPFLSERKMEDFLVSSGLETDTVRVDVQTYLIRCSSKSAIVSILGRCTSEAIVFMTDTDGCSAHQTLIAVDNYVGNYRDHVTPFMSRLDVHGGFFFFAETHESVEVLGTEDFIRRRCLSPVLDEVARATTPEAC